MPATRLRARSGLCGVGAPWERGSRARVGRGGRRGGDLCLLRPPAGLERTPASVGRARRGLRPRGALRQGLWPPWGRPFSAGRRGRGRYRAPGVQQGHGREWQEEQQFVAGGAPPAAVPARVGEEGERGDFVPRADARL